VVTLPASPSQSSNRRHWLLLLYRVAAKPSAPRVYIWRKLKRLGAILLHDAVWVLPETPRTREQFQWIAAEIVEMGGQAVLWEAQLVLENSDEELVEQFVVQVDAAYQRIEKALARRSEDLATLCQLYQQAKQRDYFASKLGLRVRKALTSARGVKRT
jgi:hypothetical protein